ncbi:hypothetical protein N657DRAFT_639063 [Parathielavia appendiculata]|uniref:Uncharacterized protein n=1 Tax=Parathielavia appendiculata TaxID=2587402 RepID=A0AAN6UBL9_9PEZI|nr:hypothetical protein N657DRAFT_639063 [Parathielavia appendiculata]
MKESLGWLGAQLMVWWLECSQQGTPESAHYRSETTEFLPDDSGIKSVQCGVRDLCCRTEYLAVLKLLMTDISSPFLQNVVISQ